MPQITGGLRRIKKRWYKRDPAAGDYFTIRKRANLLVKLFALSLRKDSTGSPFPGMKSKIKNPQLVRRRFFILCSASSPAVAGEPASRFHRDNSRMLQEIFSSYQSFYHLIICRESISFSSYTTGILIILPVVIPKKPPKRPPIIPPPGLRRSSIPSSVAIMPVREQPQGMLRRIFLITP